MAEPDAFDDLLQLRAGLKLMVTEFPGQVKQVIPTPPHILELLQHGKGFPPFMREANPDELLEYVKGLPDSWGTW